MKKAIYYTVTLFCFFGCITGGILLSGCAGGGGSGGETSGPSSPETPGDGYFIFVDGTNGSDSAAGTKSDPVDDIKEGITLAESNGKNVCVAEGTYEVNYPGTHIVMVEGVSIYGGYRNTDGTWSRDISTYTTTITDLSTSTGVENRAVEFGEGITTDTKIDGFTINGGGGDTSDGIFINFGSPTVTNNILNGGNGSTLSMALRIMNSAAPDIMQNTIDGGSAGSESCGIRCGGDADAYIANNTISGGNGLNNSNGISCSECSPTVENNIIDAGTGPVTRAISVASGGTPIIKGNTLRSPVGGALRFGIYEYVASSQPQSVINNNFSSTLTVLYNDSNGGGSRTNIEEVNALDEDGYNPAGTVYGNTYLDE